MYLHLYLYGTSTLYVYTMHLQCSSKPHAYYITHLLSTLMLCVYTVIPPSHCVCSMNVLHTLNLCIDIMHLCITSGTCISIWFICVCTHTLPHVHTYLYLMHEQSKTWMDIAHDPLGEMEAHICRKKCVSVFFLLFTA